MFCSGALIFFCFYLFIACLHAEEDDVRRCAGQTSFQVRLTSDFFGLHIVGVQRLDRLLEQSPLNLLAEKQTHDHPGRDVGAGTRRKGLRVCVYFTVLCAHKVCFVLTLLSSSDGNLVRKRHTVPSL